ncbi:MAG: ParM/StbA family protein [Bacteroidaceae bacterium]|nr:ParM/StbA family protein [Bacteroidaceae bacterium]
MLIAIDHGNKQIKTINCEPFTSGLLESDTQPFGKDVLMYKGKYYQVTDQRIPYRKDKTEDERFFILTLFAIAKEIEEQGFYHPGVMRVQLAVGLPPAYYGTHYQSFIRYFLERGTVSFSYRGKTYSILIDNVGCYPQSYAAALTMFQTLSAIPKALVLDIGGMTADYLQIKYGEGDLSVCDSLENGVIRLYNRIESKVRAEQDILLTEREIDAILLSTEVQVPFGVASVVDRLAQEFIADLLSALRERQLELKSGPVIFVGGGSILLRKQIQKSGKVSNPLFVEDIRANARGYEVLYKLSQNGR